MKRATLMSALSLGLCCIAFHANARDVAPACTPAELFAPGQVSTTGLNESRIAFTPSRNTIYWGVNEVGGPPGSDVLITIMTADRTASGWSTPEVASFSGVGHYADSDPFVTPDGNSLIFSSNRPGSIGAYPLNDLWVVHRTASGGWGTPVNLGANVNSASNELYASTDALGNLYFASDRDRGQWDLYRSRLRADGSYAPAESLGPGTNHSHLWEFNPEISPDGRTLLYASFGRQDSLGDVDIYVSRLQSNGKFGNPVNMGPCVNSPAPEFHPTVLWERGELYFARVHDTIDFMVAPLQLPPQK